ncbi:MAG: hypothetical protein A2166_04860 [Omnitrophica WOR_2 bacterium RBG_13_41_10]|nr:MAG: hypothetical protein A2166_04860 [Omnitrophica WOR_2 bacterium RBG_13_41_10]
MAGKAKVPVLILGVLILVSLSLAVASYSLLQKEKSTSAGLREQLDDVGTRQKVTEAKLEESKNKISVLEAQLQETQGRLETLNNDLTQEKNARQESLAQLEQLKGDLEKQKSFSSDLQNKLSQAQEEVKKAQAQLSELMTKRAELESKLKELEAQVKKVELGTIVVDSGSTSAGTVSATPTASKKQTEAVSVKLEGKILVVNKEYNFIVINLGSKDGINIGDIFSVYHDNKYLGDVTVGKLHDAMASADFDSQEIKNKAREGDKVSQKTK